MECRGFVAGLSRSREMTVTRVRARGLPTSQSDAWGPMRAPRSQNLRAGGAADDLDHRLALKRTAPIRVPGSAGRARLVTLGSGRTVTVTKKAWPIAGGNYGFMGF